MYIGGSVMYVQNNTDNLAFEGRFGKFFRRIGQKAFDVMPEITPKESKKGIEKAKKYEDGMSKPHVNKLIIGGTALVTQPFIDYYNHKVDEETRTVAKNRTIAKVVACTAVGLPIRKLFYDIVQKMTDKNGSKRFSKALLPDKSVLRKYIKNDTHLKNYRNALSTTLAILVMCVTNFVLDAPLTTHFTNKLNAKSAKKKEFEQKTEVNIYG